MTKRDMKLSFSSEVVGLSKIWLFYISTFEAWYFNKMVLQNTLRSDVSAILKSIHVREIVRMGEAMIDR